MRQEQSPVEARVSQRDATALYDKLVRLAAMDADTKNKENPLSER